jgi:hypothetical protein
MPEMRHDRAPGAMWAVHYLQGVGVGVHLVLHHSLEPVDVRGCDVLVCRVWVCWLLGACWSCKIFI